MTYHFEPRYCLVCGRELPPDYRGKTCGQGCRNKLSRRKKLLRKHGALARCNAWWLLWESVSGPHGDTAKYELIKTGEYITSLVKAYHNGQSIDPPIDDYNTALGYLPNGVPVAKP